MDVQLQPTPTEPLDLSQLSSAKGLAYITAFVENRAYREANFTPDEKPAWMASACRSACAKCVAYKARPLAGVWATAPFLHNGSVPSLYQLLSPQDERATTFYKGTFEYDPRHLGYRTEAFTNGFLFDTRISGNHNSGHEFRAGERGNGVIGRLLQPRRTLGVAGIPESSRRPTGGAIAMSSTFKRCRCWRDLARLGPCSGKTVVLSIGLLGWAIATAWFAWQHRGPVSALEQIPAGEAA